MATYEDYKQEVILNFLLDNNHITEAQAVEAVEYAMENNLSTEELPSALVVAGIFNSVDEIIELVAEGDGIEFVSLETLDIRPEAIALVDQKLANQLTVLPFSNEHNELHVAVTIRDIRNVRLKADLRQRTGIGVVKFYAARSADIQKHIKTVYRNDSELYAVAAKAAAQDRDDRALEATVAEPLPEEITDEAGVAHFVDLALKQAVVDGASDIHFDPQETFMTLRYRVDGMLREIAQIPRVMLPPIVSRVKVLSSLDISKTREPQDGRLSVNMGERRIDFRVATLPTIFGEKVVMRILDNSAASMPLDGLGFSEENLGRFREAAHKPYGMLLVTGPTGSGKSTTLYSALNEVKNPELNIITVEDPVEYQLPGISQVQVHHNLTFEAVLRTILRADPDVILIGEIRDPETAAIAMKAGMTGHMVLSTLHTNDAASALTRLGDMGVQPFVTASTVVGVLSQRLVRRLCTRCKEPFTPSAEQLEDIGYVHNEERDGEPTYFQAVGCKHCNKSGYKGRLALHEFLKMTDELESLIIRGGKAFDLSAQAIEEGMIPMDIDGYRKVAKGATTFTEIKRVLN